MTGSELPIAIGKKFWTVIGSRFKTEVIERWTRHRAENFFEGFKASLLEELKTNTESTEVDTALEAILNDEKKSEVLYDAYRSVCFAKSKTLGPKIIGLLTGSLVLKGHVANSVEEQVFEAAESLSDGDLLALFKEFRKHAKDVDIAQDPKKHTHWEGDSIVVPWSKETRDSAFGLPGASPIEISPLNFATAFDEQWGVRAERLGLLTSITTQREVEYKEDSERHIDADGILTIYETTITFEAPCRTLCDLIERSFGASSAAS